VQDDDNEDKKMLIMTYYFFICIPTVSRYTVFFVLFRIFLHAVLFSQSLVQRYLFLPVPTV